MLLDILIRIRDQLAGLDRARQGFRDLNGQVARSSRQWTQQAAAALGVTAAVGLLGAEIRRVIRDMESIPGIPQETIDTVNMAKQNFAEARVQLDQWIASGAKLFSEVGLGLGYLAGAVLYGWDNAAEAYDKSEKAAKLAAQRAKEAEEAQRRQAQAARELAEISAFLEQLAGARAETRDAEARVRQVGESEGQRAVRLRQEAAEYERLAIVAQSTLESEQFRRRAKEAQADADQILVNLAREQRDLQDSLAQLEFDKLPAAQRLAVIQAEIAVLAQQTRDFSRGDAIATEQQNQALARLLELKNEEAAAEREIEEARKRAEEERKRVLRAGPGRDDVLGQIDAARESLPTLAESAGNAVRSAYGTAVNSIMAGLDGLWTRSMDLGDALLSIAGGFGRAFLQSLAQIVAEYAAKKAVMFAIDVAYSAKGLALSAATAAKSLVSWIPSAIAAGISSLGSAAAIGTAAVVAALAAFGGFESGGFTGGSEGAPAGIVHGQEFVFSAPAVRNIGAGNLASLHAAALAPAAAPSLGSGAAAGGAAQSVSVGIFDRRTSAEDYLQSERGRRFLYDTYRQMQRELG